MTSFTVIIDLFSKIDLYQHKLIFLDGNFHFIII